MKNLYYCFLMVFTTISVMSCSSQSQDTGNAGLTTENIAKKAAEKQEEFTPAVGIWDKISVKDSPGDKGKWLTSLSIGESILYLNESKTDSADGNKKYLKIRLNDGKEGWTRADFVVPEARAAVFTRETNLYKRPDLLTKSDNIFSKMDIVAVMETQDDWLKVRGKRANGKWIDEGWIKEDHISFEAVDIATAKFTKIAMEEQDEGKRQVAIKEIVSNGDLGNSVFMTDLYGMVHSNEADNTEEETLAEEIYDDEVISEYIPVADSL